VNKPYPLADPFLIWLENHCAYYALHSEQLSGLEDVEMQEVINAMTLGAFKAAGWGKRRSK
jgi:hypothetical protein